MGSRALYIAVAAMVAGGLVFTAYVLLSALSNPASRGGLMSHAEGELAKLQVLAEPPVQPQTTLRDEAGGEARLADFHGKVIMLNVWATWCAPCVREMPSLDRLEAALGSDRFAVIPVTLDRDIADARAWYDEHDIAHLPLYQERTLAIGAELGARGVPISVLYGPDGEELARLSDGAEWDSPEALALVREAVETAFSGRAPAS